MKSNIISYPPTYHIGAISRYITCNVGMQNSSRVWISFGEPLCTFHTFKLIEIIGDKTFFYFRWRKSHDLLTSCLTSCKVKLHRSSKFVKLRMQCTIMELDKYSRMIKVRMIFLHPYDSWHELCWLYVASIISFPTWVFDENPHITTVQDCQLKHHKGYFIIMSLIVLSQQ